MLFRSRERGRGTENEEAVVKRLEQAKAELAFAEEGVHDYTVVNDNLVGGEVI